MSDTESFEHVMVEMRKVVADDCVMARCNMYDDDCYQCQQDILDRLQRAYEQELEHVRKSEYARGYHDGQRSMDAEHYAVALRLMHLPLDGGSHENLSQIARSVYHADFGWTQGACSALRDELVRLMGGCVCDNASNSMPFTTTVTTSTYDVLGNERHKAVCELRKIHADAGGFVKALANALGVEWQAPRVHQTIAEVRDQLIHLLGGDEPDLQKSPIFEDSGNDDAGEITITDELRKFATDPLLGYASQELHVKRITAIADRIDEQFNRICEQQETVLQQTIDEMAEERDELQRRLDAIREALDG